jgi:hypothetical protein
MHHNELVYYDAQLSFNTIPIWLRRIDGSGKAITDFNVPNHLVSVE